MLPYRVHVKVTQIETRAITVCAENAESACEQATESFYEHCDEEWAMFLRQQTDLVFDGPSEFSVEALTAEPLPETTS